MAYYSGIEYKASTDAEVAQMPAAKEVLQAEVVLNRAKKFEIAAAAQELATNYSRQVSNSISIWRKAFEDCKDGDVAKMGVFQSKLGEKPALDAALSGKLSTLCQ